MIGKVGAKQADKQTTLCMQKKLLRDNTFLRTIIYVDPLLVVSPSGTQLKRMLRFPQFLTTVLNEDEDEDMKFMKTKYVHYPLMLIFLLHWKRKGKMMIMKLK